MFNEMEKTVKKLLTIIKKNYNGYPNEKCTDPKKLDKLNLTY